MLVQVTGDLLFLDENDNVIAHRKLEDRAAALSRLTASNTASSRKT